MFFPGGDATQTVLVKLAEEEVRRAGGRANCRLEGQFAAISSDVDWMTGTKFSILELFTRIVPLPDVANSHRMELLIGASCVGWLTACGDDVVAHNLEEGDLAPTLRAISDGAQRTLFWHFDPEHWVRLKAAADSGQDSIYD